MDKKKVLFICGHNSGRSQMAEAFLKDIAGDRIHVESAGLEPKPVNPLVVEVMQEIGFDLSNARSDSVFDFFKAGRLYDYVITDDDDVRQSTVPIQKCSTGFGNLVLCLSTHLRELGLEHVQILIIGFDNVLGGH